MSKNKKIKVGVSVGVGDSSFSKKFPILMTVQVAFDNEEPFNSVLSIAKKLKKNKKAVYDIHEFPTLGSKDLQIEFAKLDDVRPIINEVKGTDLYRHYWDFNGLIPEERRTTNQIIDKISAIVKEQNLLGK